jgi:putative membrane protein
MIPLAITALAAALYAAAALRIRRRRGTIDAARAISFGVGIALLLAATLAPLEGSFAAHMSQHLLIGDLAPLFVVLGLSGPLLRPALALRPVRSLRVLAHPLVALPLWTIDLYVWHLPFLYQAALHHDSVHALEHLMFFTWGGLMWAPVLEVLPAPEWFGTGWKLGYIVSVRLIETVLGNVFIWSGKVFYPYYEHVHPLWGISAFHDQGLAGAVMMLEGSIVTIATLAWLFLRLASEGELRQELLERGLDPRAVQRAVRYGRAQEFSPPR